MYPTPVPTPPQPQPSQGQVDSGAASTGGYSILDYNQWLAQQNQNSGYWPTPTQQQPAPQQTSSGALTQDQRNALFKQQTGGNIAPIGWQPSAPQLQSVSADDINSIFQPLDAGINSQEANQQSQLGTTLQQILSQGNTLQAALDTQNQQQQNLTDQQKGTLDTEQDSALTQAAKQYQWALQSAGNQFGYNGAEIGMQGLAQQELAYQQGNTQQQYAQAYGKLLLNQSNLYSYTQQKKSEINSWVADQQQQARQTLQDNLTSLENTRFAIQSDKAKMTVQAIQQMHDAYNQINLAAYQSQLALDTWKQQYMTQLNSGIQGIQSQAVNYAAQNPFNTNYQQNTYSQPQQVASTAYQAPKASDPYSNLYYPTQNTLGQ